MSGPRRVTFTTYEDNGCWWAKLCEHGTPVPEGAMPNIAHALFWSGATRQAAIDKALTFIRNAALVLEAKG